MYFGFFIYSTHVSVLRAMSFFVQTRMNPVIAPRRVTRRFWHSPRSELTVVNEILASCQ